MKFLFAVVFMVLADRAFPASARRFGGSFFETTPQQFYKKYGIISFPRTIFAVLACLSFTLGYFFSVNDDTQGFIAVSLGIFYSISASFDVIRARK